MKKLMALAGVLVLLLVVLMVRAEAKARRKAMHYDPPVIWGGGFATDKEQEAAQIFKRSKYSVPAGVSWETKRQMWYTPKPGMSKSCVCFGAQGSLKTSSLQIPTALQFEGSMLIFESTLETAITSAEARLKWGPVILLASGDEHQRYFRNTGVVARRYNPHAPYWCNPRLRAFWDRSEKIALGLVPEQETREPYFNMRSRHLTQAIGMALSILYPQHASAGNVARIMFRNPRGFCRMAANRLPPGALRDLLWSFVYPPPEIKSVEDVIQNACMHLKPFLTPHCAYALSRSEFTIGSLRQRRQTVIVVRSMESMGAEYDPFLTFVFESGLSEIQSDQFAGREKLAVMIDEALQFPRMTTLIRAMTSLRKYNTFMILCANHYEGLVAKYGKEASVFLNDAGMISWMGTKSTADCKTLSEMLGDTEVFRQTKSIPLIGNGSITENWSKEKRPLMAPFEIAQNLGARDQIVFIPDCGVGRPILCKKRPYFEDWKLKRKARANPFNHSKKGFWR